MTDAAPPRFDGSEAPQRPAAGASRLHRPVLRFLWAALIVAGGTLVAEALYRAFDMTRLSMIFLAAVLLTALYLGRSAALFAAGLAFFVYNFYLVEPRFTFQFASADDFLTLVLFLTVALVTGSLAGRVRDEVIQRRARERTLSTLFDATRLMSATESDEVLRERLADSVALAARSCAVVLGEDDVRRTSGRADLSHDALAVAAELAAKVRAEPGRGTLRVGVWRVRALNADERSFGAVVWRAPDEDGGRAVDAEGLINVLVDLGAAAIARARLSAAKAEMDALTRAEKLRTALLSSISHDFRTPLSAILASATSMLEYDDRLPPAVRRDLLLSIQEEVERLNRFVANLLSMTRLESGALEVRTEPVQVRELVDRVLRRLERRSGARTLTQKIDDRDLAVEADPVLLEQVLTNIAENAIAYSPDNSEIMVRAEEVDGSVRIDVADEGEGVSPSDLPRIFDKFYRAADPRSSGQGAGLGLSIARGLVEAMAGQVRASGREDGRHGLTVEICLPPATSA